MAISARVCARSLASRFDSGSSMRNTDGSRTIARPIATRWRWPPESCPGLRPSQSSSCSILAALWHALRISSFGSLASFRAKPMFCSTVMCG